MCVVPQDRRCAHPRKIDGAMVTVAGLAAAEPLRALPAFVLPTVIEVTRTVTTQAPHGRIHAGIEEIARVIAATTT